MQADNIQERKRNVTLPGNKTNSEKYIEVTRDIVNEVKMQATVVLVAIENQSDIHYAMPVRVMSGDCGSYNEQWKKTALIHREKGDLKGAEYLSGFAKNDRLVPSITIAVYLGREPWDGPRTLKDMFDMEELPEGLRKYVADYPMILLEVRKWEELENFQTDIRYVFGYLQSASSEAQLEKYISHNQEGLENMREDAFDFICAVSHSKELEQIKDKFKREEGDVNMCQALKDMIASGERRGRQQGIQQGMLLAQKIFRMKMQGESYEKIAKECDMPEEEVLRFFES